MNKKNDSIKTIQGSAENQVENSLDSTTKIQRECSFQQVFNCSLKMFDVSSSTVFTQQKVLQQRCKNSGQTPQVNQSLKLSDNDCLRHKNSLMQESQSTMSTCSQMENYSSEVLQAEYKQLKDKFVHYSRLLYEKQQEINQLELENHNIRIQVKNFQSLVDVATLEKDKISQLYTISEGYLEQFRKQIFSLRQQIAGLKRKHTQDLAKSQRDIKQQYGYVFTQKNSQIVKLHNIIKERDAEIQYGKEQVQNLKKQLQKASERQNQFKLVIDYQRKQNKILGVELSNSRKKRQQLIQQKQDISQKFEETKNKNQILLEKIAYVQVKIQDMERENQKKLKQNQHQKSLLYEKLTNAIKIKDRDIAHLSRELAQFTKCSQQKYQLQQLTCQQRKHFKNQNTEKISQLDTVKCKLKKQLEEKRNIQSERNRLLQVLRQTQNRINQQKLKSENNHNVKNNEAEQNIQLVVKNQEFDRLTIEIKIKNAQIINLQKSIKGLQDKYIAQQSLLASTNQELFLIRLKSLGDKFRIC